MAKFECASDQKPIVERTPRARGRHCSGSVDPKIAALICAGFLVGASVVVKFATALSNAVLEKVFTVALLWSCYVVAMGLQLLAFHTSLPYLFGVEPLDWMDMFTSR